ncbi:hypothetical protein ACTFIW_001916, partial [Dictyostelium discoideum]
IIQIYGSK